jgi:hypothetical protein
MLRQENPMNFSRRDVLKLAALAAVSAVAGIRPVAAKSHMGEAADTAAEGQTVCSVFDVSDPFQPSFITQIPLGSLDLPSGKLRNKKSINLVYVRPGTRSQAG